MITTTERPYQVQPFQVGYVFTSDFLKKQYGYNQGKLIPIQVIEVKADTDEIIVDWGSGSGLDTWKFTHCIDALQRGEYKRFKPKNILHLPIKRKWFDMILSGEKLEEYREIKGYWFVRLTDKAADFKEFDIVRLRAGYGKKAAILEIECLGIEINYSDPKWCDGVVERCYCIKLGRIFNKINC